MTDSIQQINKYKNVILLQVVEQSACIKGGKNKSHETDEIMVAGDKQCSREKSKDVGPPGGSVVIARREVFVIADDLLPSTLRLRRHPALLAILVHRRQRLIYSASTGNGQRHVHARKP